MNDWAHVHCGAKTQACVANSQLSQRKQTASMAFTIVDTTGIPRIYAAFIK